MQRLDQRRILFGIVILGVLLLMAFADLRVTAQESNAGVGLNLFYMARRNSQIEPCGCKTKQRGGMFYEAALYDRHNDAPSIRVDAGEFTKHQIQDFPLDAHRGRFLLRGVAMLHYDAINLGLNDIENHAAFYESVIGATPELKSLFISANVYQKAAPDRLAFPPYKIVERDLKDGSHVKVGILGATATNRTTPKDSQAETEWATHDYVAKSASAALAAPLSEVAAQTQLQILLFSGSYEESMQLAREFPELDYIVTTGRFPDSSMPLYIEGDTRLLQIQNVQAKELGFVKIAPSADGVWEPVAPPQSLFVAVDLPINADIKAVADEYTAQIKAADQAMRPITKGKSNFAGSARCVTCHTNHHRDWNQTGHATALLTLVNTGDLFRNECTPCHTTGSDDPNGFRGVGHSGSRGLFNVQCEACHGPALEHADVEQRLRNGAEKWMKPEQLADYKKRSAEVMPPKAVPAQVCIRCHDTANDPTFDYEKDLPLVSHLKVDKTPGAKLEPLPAATATPAAAPAASANPAAVPRSEAAHSALPAVLQ